MSIPRLPVSPSWPGPAPAATTTATAAPAPAPAPAPASGQQQLASQAQQAFHQGLAHHRADRLEEACLSYAGSMALYPADSQSANNMAVACRKLGRRELAEALYRRSLTLDPDNVSTLVNRGNLLRDLGRLAEAEASHRRALELSPDTRGALYGLGLVYRDMKRLEESIACLHKVLEQSPEDAEVIWDLAQSLLGAGDYLHGFIAYEARWNLGAMSRPDYPAPHWEGQPLDGKTILLYGEQGFGDVIQFVRLVPLLTRQGARVILHVRPELVSLLSGQWPGVTVAALTSPDPADAPACDLVFPLLSLPRQLGLKRQDIPSQPYLKAPDRPPVFPPRLAPAATGSSRDSGEQATGSQETGSHRASGSLLKVGLCWQGSPGQRNDRNRSLPFAALLPLLGLPRLSLFSLQKGEAASAPRDLGIQDLVVPLDPLIHDFADTAALIAGLDLVITADTSVLHVAAALGKPVWVLLSVFHDWRFDRQAGISTWYPRARVFCQKTPGDWDEVMQRVLVAMDELLEKVA